MDWVALILANLFWAVVAFTVGWTMAKGRVPRLHRHRPFIR